MLPAEISCFRNLIHSRTCYKGNFVYFAQESSSACEALWEKLFALLARIRRRWQGKCDVMKKGNWGVHTDDVPETATKSCSTRCDSLVFLSSLLLISRVSSHTMSFNSGRERNIGLFGVLSSIRKIRSPQPGKKKVNEKTTDRRFLLRPFSIRACSLFVACRFLVW